VKIRTLDIHVGTPNKSKWMKQMDEVSTFHNKTYMLKIIKYIVVQYNKYNTLYFFSIIKKI